MRIAIVGVGRLGSAFARVLSKHNEIFLIDKDFPAANSLAIEIGAEALRSVAEAEGCDMFLVAVKPAHVKEVAEQLKGAPLVISCAAGITINKFEQWGIRKIIRIMPNICVQAGEGVIAYSLHPETEKSEKNFLTAFSSLGLLIKSDESHLDPITAISGSGPAFIAYVAEAMIVEAVSEGLSQETAEKSVAQTLIGTGKLMRSGWDTKKIIETVASPGGTTEAGLRMLDENGAAKSIKDAVKFATKKARELGK